MMKKLFTALICIAFIAAMGVTSFAAGPHLINITRPEGDEESTFKKSYVICGNTANEGITVELSVYDNDLGYYVPYANTEGETSWGIGSSGMFMKEVNLKYTGANKIQVVAYKNSDTENRQVEKFTIILLKEDLKNKLMNMKVKDIFTNANGF